MIFVHKSVLLQEVLQGIAVKPEGIYVDGTLGGAGHSYEICKRLSPKGHLVGIDQDAAAIKAAEERLAEYQNQVTIVRSNYSQMPQVLDKLHINKVDGILLDLGVSSYQLDTPDRGFSFRDDARLDMRMDDRQTLSAYEVVNEYTEKQLFYLIKDYGEEKFAQNIAKHIVAERTKSPVETTGRLAEIISQSIPMKIRKQGGHPAKRTFQAIRIEVNHELDVLKDTLEQMIDLLAPDGRLCVITFHSLEDRIVKQIFRTAQNPCTCPPNFPVCVCGKVPKGKMLTRKPVLPTEEEMEENPRSKSAKLRVFVHK